MILFFLVVWFFIWGICPWNNSSPVAQTAEATHADHGHHGDMDDTHHASKGTEHSCSGSISYSIKLKDVRPYEHVVPVLALLPDLAIRLVQIHGRLRPPLERSTLPKLLTQYYQLYSVYRI